MAKYIPKKRINKRKPVYKRKSSVAKSNLVKLVQGVINKNLENKEAFHSLSGNFNSGISTGTGGEIMQIIPNITQGLSDNARVGDQVRAKNLEVAGFVSMNLTYTTAASARIAVRMMIVQPKTLGSLGPIQSNTGSWLSSLIKKGGTTTSFAGNIDDLYAPINSDAITKYYDKVVYLNLPYMNTAVGETSTMGSTRLFKLNINLRNKLIRYDSTYSATSPVEYNPVMLLGYVHLDGSGPDLVNTQAFLSYSSRLSYQDA